MEYECIYNEKANVVEAVSSGKANVTQLLEIRFFKSRDAAADQIMAGT